MRGHAGRWLFVLALLVLLFIAALFPFLTNDRADHQDIMSQALTIEALPYDPAGGLTLYEARPLPAEARCPVCGMYPARYPRWAAQLIFDDGGALFFDSPLELFRFLLRMDHYYTGHAPHEVARAFVSDVGDGRWVPIADAYYVQGSRLLGPMRNQDLPAFAEREAAEVLVAEQGGNWIRLEQITLDLLQALEPAGH